MADKTLETIAQGEGTTDAQAQANNIPSGYDVSLAYNIYGTQTKPISKMTMAELDTYQTSMLNDPNNNWNSSAAGKYQITRTTRRELQAQLGISDDTVYTPQLQDQMANVLLNRRGKAQFEAGKITLAEYQNNIAKEWASMPTTDGTGYYDGQGGHISQGQIQDSIRSDRAVATGDPAFQSASAASASQGNQVTGQATKNATNATKKVTGTSQPNATFNNQVAGYKAEADRGPDNPQDITADNELKSVFEAPFAPRPNMFQQFSTMTYSVSLYLLGPGQYDNMIKTGNKKVNGLTLFMQSGGAANSDSNVKYGAKRSEFFPTDFYLDNIKLESLVSGSATMGSHNSFNLKFTITEPAGISFFDRLMMMVKKEYPNEKNYTSHPYLMVIRFYGYDASGNPISGQDLPELTEPRSDVNSVGEKFIPFNFTKINFRLHDDKVDYSCEAVCPQSQFGHDLAHGTIPSQMTIQGNTLAELINGQEQNGAYNFLTQGFTKVLNGWQRGLVAGGQLQHPDTYKVVFEDINPTKIKVLDSDSSMFLKSSGMHKNDDQSVSFLGNKMQAIFNKKQISVNAGTKIAKVLDIIMQTSSYITDQVIAEIDAQTGEDKKKPTKEDLKWFKIRTVAIPQKDKWDKLRNDFAYDITYVISPYAFTADSEYANKVKKNCFSIHKEYNYWFTGQNTEVISFSQDFNYLYYGVTNKKLETPEREKKRTEFNVNNTRRYMHMVNSGGSLLASSNGKDEIAANISSELYSLADQANAEIDILGDPDFISQSEIFYSPIGDKKDTYLNLPFMPDGSVNYDTGEVYFTINYNTIVDYDLNTGLADTTQENFGRDLQNGKAGVSKYSFVYRANTITTQLVDGKFTQRLKGTIKIIPEMCTFAMPDTQVKNMARRENPSQKDTTVSTAGTAKNGYTGVLANPTMAPSIGKSENNLVFPSDGSDLNINSSPLPDETGAFNSREAINAEQGTVRDTPEPVKQSLSITEPDSEPDPYLINLANDTFETVNDTVIAVTDTVSDAVSQTGRFTKQVFTAVDDLGDDLREAAQNINFTENNPLDGGNA